MQGGTDAAVAESKRLEALAQLGDAAERYVTVATGQRLLRWAIDRYRERKQGPLLQRASALFSQLTLGGFSRLVPDFETTPPKLIALRGSGERVGIEGLSEGTRDQLFLALRLAALEMQIANDRPLPFIADDLFVNFHDSRSRAGLAALGELARKTQVIFLTHHEHLVEVARECVGSDINVVELGVD
jgi:chromosome segregation protein